MQILPSHSPNQDEDHLGKEVRDDVSVFHLNKWLLFYDVIWYYVMVIWCYLVVDRSRWILLAQGTYTAVTSSLDLNGQQDLCKAQPETGTLWAQKGSRWVDASHRLVVASRSLPNKKWFPPAELLARWEWLAPLLIFVGRPGWTVKNTLETSHPGSTFERVRWPSVPSHKARESGRCERLGFLGHTNAWGYLWHLFPHFMIWLDSLSLSLSLFL